MQRGASGGRGGSVPPRRTRERPREAALPRMLWKAPMQHLHAVTVKLRGCQLLLK